jgi:hypothetical protein
MVSWLQSARYASALMTATQQAQRALRALRVRTTMPFCQSAISSVGFSSLNQGAGRSLRRRDWIISGWNWL